MHMESLSNCEVRNKPLACRPSSALYFSTFQAESHLFKKLQNSESLNYLRGEAEGAGLIQAEEEKAARGPNKCL